MASLNGVNTNAEPAKNFEPFPAGWYKAIIKSEEMKMSKSGYNYLSLTVQIIEGPYQGRLIPGHNLNLWNVDKWFDKNGKEHEVREISEAELSSIREAAGISKESFVASGDTRVLFNKPLMIKVIIDPNPGYEQKNVIKGWKPIASVPTVGGNLAKATPPTSGTTSYTPPVGTDGKAAYLDDVPGF